VPAAAGALLRDMEALGQQQVQRSRARVMATYSRRRSSSISAVLPVARSAGMQPSTTLSTCTECHSWPLAEWMVDRIR
jgi:hypothetical protein